MRGRLPSWADIPGDSLKARPRTLLAPEERGLSAYLSSPRALKREQDSIGRPGLETWRGQYLTL